jgi:hypothetical protein
MVGQVSTKRWRDSLNDEVGSYSKIDQTAVDAHGALKFLEAGEVYVRCKGRKEHTAPNQLCDGAPLGLGEGCVFLTYRGDGNEGLSLLNISEGVQLYIRVCGDEMW